MAGNDKLAEKMAEVSRGLAAGSLVHLLEEEIGKLQREVDGRVETQMATGGLTPEVALQAWYEKMAYRRLLKRLTTTADLGRVASEQLSPQMERK